MKEVNKRALRVFGMNMVWGALWCMYAAAVMLVVGLLGWALTYHTKWAIAALVTIVVSGVVFWMWFCAVEEAEREMRQEKWLQREKRLHKSNDR